MWLLPGSVCLFIAHRICEFGKRGEPAARGSTLLLTIISSCFHRISDIRRLIGYIEQVQSYLAGFATAPGQSLHFIQRNRVLATTLQSPDRYRARGTWLNAARGFRLR